MKLFLYAPKKKSKPEVMPPFITVFVIICIIALCAVSFFLGMDQGSKAIVLPPEEDWTADKERLYKVNQELAIENEVLRGTITSLKEDLNGARLSS
jgi:hypothetical protein